MSMVQTNICIESIFKQVKSYFCIKWHDQGKWWSWYAYEDDDAQVMHVNDATITLGCYSPPPLQKSRPEIWKLTDFRRKFYKFLLTRLMPVRCYGFSMFLHCSFLFSFCFSILFYFLSSSYSFLVLILPFILFFFWFYFLFFLASICFSFFFSDFLCFSFLFYILFLFNLIFILI